MSKPSRQRLNEVFEKAESLLEDVTQNGYSNRTVKFVNKEGREVPLSAIQGTRSDAVQRILDVTKGIEDPEQLRQEIEKATIALSDLTSGGLLAVQQENTFIDLLREQSVMLDRIRYEKMRGPSQEFNKRAFSKGHLKLASQDPSGTSPYAGREFEESLKSKPTLSKVGLQVVESMAQLEFPYEVVEDNIERGQFTDFTMREFRDVLGVDMEDILINGDTASGNNTLKIRDGVLKLATTNIHDGGAGALTSDQVKAVLKKLPTRYNRDRRNYLLFAAKNAALDYQFELLSKATGYGDRMLTTDMITAGGFMGAGGVTVIPTDLMPDAQALFLNPQNVVIGFHRDLTFEMERDIERRVFRVVATARFDIKLIEEQAVVKVTNLAV
jgi:HK97 family phage major capsid protein